MQRELRLRGIHDRRPAQSRIGAVGAGEGAVVVLR